MKGCSFHDENHTIIYFTDTSLSQGIHDALACAIPNIYETV